jgi:hypothetical protein
LKALAGSACTALLWLLCGCGLADSVASGGAAASQAPGPGQALTVAALQDPENCKGCHAQHYREWRSSMHAYAAKDPVFIAMNERGQIETKGELGDFCVRCHAPMAVELGLTTDGLNLPDLKDPNARGVTCYVCHDATGVREDHNQNLELAHDRVMRGGIGQAQDDGGPPVASSAHDSAYSELHDARQLSSAGLCGSCHDVVNHGGAAIERTFQEWRESRFARPGPELSTCGSCHMQPYQGRAASDGPERQLHRHLWPGVDNALEKKFPGLSAQQAAIDCGLHDAIELLLTHGSSGPAWQSFDVQLSNDAVGHAFPSGAAQDRRAWVEFIAYDESGAVLYRSGVFAEGEIVTSQPPGGEAVEVFRDQLYDASGAPVHFIWQAAPSAAHPLGYQSNLLPPGGSRTLHYELPRAAARVTARLRLRPLGLEILDDFQGVSLPITERVIDTGYLDAGPIRNRVRTLDLHGTERELVREPSSMGASAASPGPGAEDADDCAAQSYLSLLVDE